MWFWIWLVSFVVLGALLFRLTMERKELLTSYKEREDPRLAEIEISRLRNVLKTKDAWVARLSDRLDWAYAEVDKWTGQVYADQKRISNLEDEVGVLESKLALSEGNVLTLDQALSAAKGRELPRFSDHSYDPVRHDDEVLA